MSASRPYLLEAARARYGALLGFADPVLATAWCGPSRLKQVAFRSYCRLFGYPELAAHRRYSLIREALKSRECSCVVDVGTRNGLYTLADALARPTTTYVGVDISAPHLRRLSAAAKGFSLHVYPLRGRAEALPLPDECADGVLTIEVLQFVNDDRQAVNEIGRVLCRGGLWWCEQELESAGRMTGEPRDRTLLKHRRGHSSEGLQALANAAGLRLVTTRPVDGAIGRWWEGLESRIREHSRTLHLVTFPILRLLAAATANRWTERSPATVLYCFERTR